VSSFRSGALPAGASPLPGLPASSISQQLRYHAPVLVLVAVIAVLPLLMPNSFYFDLANKAMLSALVCVGLNLMIGYAGQISLGHGAFFALGAYASALLTGQYKVPPLLALVLGAVATALIAAAIGRPILRLKGHYLAMATLGFGVILHTIFMREVGWSGGPDGRTVAAFSVGDWRVTRPQHWYWVIAATLVGGVLVARMLIDSAFGRALRALHGAENAAASSGVSLADMKLRVLVISAVYASVAGSLFAHTEQFITPGEASFLRSIEFVTMVVFGGLASVFGSIVGATLLTVLGQLSANFSDYKHIVFGGILMVTMTMMPAGLVPTLARKLRRRR